MIGTVLGLLFRLHKSNMRMMTKDLGGPSLFDVFKPMSVRHRFVTLSGGRYCVKCGKIYGDNAHCVH